MRGRNKQYSKEELKQTLVDLYDNWGITKAETIRRCDDMASPGVFVDRFGSIKQAREVTDVERERYREKVSEEKIKSIMREHERSGKQITRRKVPDEVVTLVSRCNKTIAELRREAGLLRKHSNTTSFRRSKVEMIEELREVENPVSNDDIEEMTSYSTNEYAYTFGNTTKAIKMAGKESKQHANTFWYTVTGKYNFEDAIEEIDGYKRDAPYYVYRIRFPGDFFYVGATSNLRRRVTEKSHWPKDNPIDIYVESLYDKERCNERETELTFETAIEFDTNDVYGGHMSYS